jgi:hypothetical protein
MEQFGNADARHHGIEQAGQFFGVRHLDRANRRYLEATVPVSYPIQRIALQTLGKCLQPRVQFTATLFQPCVGR